MTEIMLMAYLKEKNLLLYEDGTLRDINSVSGLVFFTQVSECRVFTEYHQIDIFDILVWVFSKTREGAI